MATDPLDELDRAIDAVAAMDSFSLSDPVVVTRLERSQAKLDSAVTTAVAAFDESGEWALVGAKNAAAWMATKCHLSLAEARGQVRRARALPLMPLAQEAYSSGEIGTAQVDALVRTRSANEELFTRDEAILVKQAETLKFGPLTAVLDYWVLHADPDGAQEAQLAREARCDVYVTPSVGGMYLGKITLEPYSGATFTNELARLERIMFEADWAEAKERLGREPKLHELRRTSAQRRAAAAVEMAIRSATAPKDGQRPEPLITILVDHPTLSGQISRIEGGPVVPPGSILQHMSSAWFERIVFAPDGRGECSVKARFFTGATRRVIEVRDLECTHPYCEKKAKECQIDHIIPYSQGGLTEQANGQVLCQFHNLWRVGREPPGG
jgi:Domain of unknown function (DUF222)/HNH endonuclease